MTLKNIFKWLLYILSILVILFCSIAIYFLSVNLLNPSSGNITLNTGDVGTKTQDYSLKEKVSTLAIRLKIPRIKVDSAIESVGLTTQGELDVPKEITNVAWYNLSPMPGEVGTSVMDGHFGWKGDVQAVFDNLHLLNKGDKIYIVGKDNTITTFIVREIKTYELSDDVSEIFASDDNKAHLNLITCYGEWNKTEQTYPKRLTVFTDREN